jgi:predicted NAD/FAD-binding protein
MSTETRHPLPARLHTLAAMAGLLERLEGAPSTASAEQYRGVARQVSALLARAEPDEHLALLLNAAPHTAELYENLRYDVAGLCRNPLEAALNAELAATAAIRRARGG